MSETSLPFDEKYYPRTAKISSGEKRKQDWEKAIKDPQEYWSEKAKAIDWFKPFSKVLDNSNPPFFKWFPDGELNICYNALDRHITGNRKNKLAYIWEGEMGEVKTYTYYQLYREVNKLAKALKNLGVKKGDRVAVFLPVIPSCQCRCWQQPELAESIPSCFQDSALKHWQTESTTAEQKS